MNYFNIALDTDLTLFAAILVLFGTLINFFIKDNNYRIDAKSFLSIYLLALFYLWINVTIIYSLSSEYCYDKSFLFLTNILAFITPILYKGFDIIKFLRFLTICSIALSILFMVFYSAIIYSSVYSDVVFGGLYLSLGELLGLSLLISVIFKGIFSPFVSWLLLILSAMLLIFTGSRGPILFTGVVLILYFMVGYISMYKIKNDGWPFKRISAVRLLSLGFVVGIILFLLSNIFEAVGGLVNRSIARLTILFHAIYHGNIGDPSGRIDHFVFAIDNILDSTRSLFLGYGLGSYNLLLNGTEGRAYPHNIILEIWLETGLIGLFLFSVFLISLFRKRISSNPFIWFGIYLFLNAMKSSSLVDLRLFFAVLALFAVFSKTAVATKYGKKARLTFCRRNREKRET